MRMSSLMNTHTRSFKELNLHYKRDPYVSIFTITKNTTKVEKKGERLHKMKKIF